MIDRETVIAQIARAVETAFDVWIDEYTGCSWFKEDKVRQAKQDALAFINGQPQIVRCKDCNNRGTSDCPIEELCNGWIPSDDWFCADGEPRAN